MTMNAKNTKKKTGVILLVIVFVLPLLILYNQHRILIPWVQDSNITIAETLTMNKNILPSSHFADELHFFVQHDPHTVGCGGCDALNELIQSLKDLGFHVEGMGIFSCPDPSSIEGIIPSNRTLVFVHPEVDNSHCGPLFPNRSSVTVRWILAPPGIMSAPLKDLGYSSDDLVFSYGPNMIEATSHSYSNTLMVIKNPFPGDETDIPEELFYNKNRSGILWTMRKGNLFHSNISFIHEQPGIPSTNKEHQITVEDFVKYEYFVSYDPLTYLTVLAAMSGTVSIVYPVSGQTKEEWSMGSFLGPYLYDTGNTVIPGIAYGWNESEISFARQTIHRARPFLVDMKRWGVETTVARFARDCYRYKNGTRTNFEAGLLVKDAYPSLFK